MLDDLHFHLYFPFFRFTDERLIEYSKYSHFTRVFFFFHYDSTLILLILLEKVISTQTGERVGENGVSLSVFLLFSACCLYLIHAYRLTVLFCSFPTENDSPMDSPSGRKCTKSKLEITSALTHTHFVLLWSSVRRKEIEALLVTSTLLVFLQMKEKLFCTNLQTWNVLSCILASILCMDSSVPAFIMHGLEYIEWWSGTPGGIKLDAFLWRIKLHIKSRRIKIHIASEQNENYRSRYDIRGSSINSVTRDFY